MDFPYEIKKLPDSINNKLLEQYSGEKQGFVQIGPKKYFMPLQYREEAERIFKFEVRPTDVWIVTFPRSGTTITQEIVWLLKNNLDFEKAKAIPLIKRSPFIEWSTLVSREIREDLFEVCNNTKDEKLIVELNGWTEDKINILENDNKIRIIKTHLPPSLLPPNLLSSGAKVIYVARNPKDSSVSFYNLCKAFTVHGFTENFPTFWNNFENGLALWSPYWEHINEGWALRNHPNVFFGFFENVIKNVPYYIKELATFLDVKISEHDIENIANHTDMTNFSKNSAVNIVAAGDFGMKIKNTAPFIRKGVTGNWKEYFNKELNEQADRWIAKNLEKFEIDFPEDCQIFSQASN